MVLAGMAVLAAAGAAALVRHTTAARRVAMAAGPYRALLDLPAEDGRRWSPADLDGREVLLCFFCGCPQCHALARLRRLLVPPPRERDGRASSGKRVPFPGGARHDGGTGRGRRCLIARLPPAR
jgi:hypothetical protein